LTTVLDAAALMAEFNSEPGAERVLAAYPDVLTSSVNVAEVIAKLTERGATTDETTEIVGRMRCPIRPFDASQALLAGQLRASTRALGLSLGDRACLALALTVEARRVLTTDRAWLRLDLGLDIRVIR
jgi:ribonuclease VapC